MNGLRNTPCSDLVQVKGREQHFSRAQTATVIPSQEQQQSRQRLELQFQQVPQLRELLVLNQVKCSDLPEGHMHDSIIQSPPTCLKTCISYIQKNKTNKKEKTWSQSTYQDLFQKVFSTPKALKINGFPNGWTIFVAT